MEQINENENKPTRNVAVVDRVTLGKDESNKLDQWLKQVDDAFKGVVKLTKSDFVNHLVREHKDTLTKKELRQLRVAHFDEIKFATWALSKLKDAKRNGESLTLEELIQLQNSAVKMAEVQTVEQIEPKRRGRKKENSETEKVDDNLIK